jgi:hypothetical protein
MKSVSDIVMGLIYRSIRRVKKIAEKCRQIALLVVVVSCLKLQNVGHIDNCYGNKDILHDMANAMCQCDLGYYLLEQAL